MGGFGGGGGRGRPGWSAVPSADVSGSSVLVTLSPEDSSAKRSSRALRDSSASSNWSSNRRSSPPPRNRTSANSPALWLLFISATNANWASRASASFCSNSWCSASTLRRARSVTHRDLAGSARWDASAYSAGSQTGLRTGPAHPSVPAVTQCPRADDDPAAGRLDSGASDLQPVTVTASAHPTRTLSPLHVSARSPGARTRSRWVPPAGGTGGGS